MNRYICFLLFATFVFTSGCGYGKVSPTTYELAKSLYNVSNRKLSDKLDIVEERIETAETSKEISAREAKWLRGIANLAEQEQWNKAMKSARRMMEDQVSR